jgi:lipopolysaccharide transport system ATP-binding protein
VRSEEQPGVRDTHYVRGLRLQYDGVENEIPLEFVDIRQPGNLATLDLTDCEWGRLFGRYGTDCRILTARTGARKGGHILAVRPPAYRDRDWPIRLSFESQSIGKMERLIADWLDVNSVKWVKLTTLSRSAVSDGWEEFVCTATIPPVDDSVRDRSVVTAQLDLTPPVNILDIAVCANGERVYAVRERQPFTIRVTLEQHRPIPESSVNLTIVRLDGVYVFWQTSEWFEKKLVDFAGTAEVEFHFNENLFGAGDYEITVFVVNGWSWENVPPSEIFDRRLGTVHFKVYLENSMEFGLINVRVPVTHKLAPKPFNGLLSAMTETKT